MKTIIYLFCLIFLTSCNENFNNSDIGLSSFIKPQYLFKESSLSCRLIDGENLNSVERFIPKFVDSFSDDAIISDELFFLFPFNEDETETETQSFNILLQYQDQVSIDKFNFTLDALSFDEIANCENFSKTRSSLRLNTNPINGSPLIVEILECRYLDNFNYATMKIILEQFINSLLNNSFPVDIFYSQQVDSNNMFQWKNIFLTIESRRNFIDSWQQLDISKEVQSSLLEQSICDSSNTFRQYKVL